MNFKEYKNPTYAIDFLSEHLIKGSLILFLGAGTSKGFGLPDWLELTNSFRKFVGLNEVNIASTPEVLQNAIDEALDKINNEEGQKLELVRKILYPKENFDVSMAYSNHLLISIASLLMGTKRGHVNRVVTLNYDSMLEWFLNLFGFQVNSISILPALEGSEDVRIYHPHGFVPHPALKMQASNFLILGLKDANNRLGKRGDLWFEKIRTLLESGVCLFIGLSGNTLSDRAIAPLLSSTGDSFKHSRPLGIWINKGELDKTKEDEYFRNNIVPIEIKNDIEISEFVLKISQKALEKQNK
jgi:hypothetical protein